ncbi:hypothetical protein [Stackebrandtia soli]|uniref:hypothetical protein n=1 Tax=Stackebrandtia soli TaxID=1892856 RepID=UPI0039E9D802
MTVSYRRLGVACAASIASLAVVGTAAASATLAPAAATLTDSAESTLVSWIGIIGTVLTLTGAAIFAFIRHRS